MAELLLNLAQRHTLADLVYRRSMAEVAPISRPQRLAVEDLHCGNQRGAPDEPPALFVAHRQPATLPRAKEVSRRRHPAVFSQRPQRAEQVRIDIDQLAA